MKDMYEINPNTCAIIALGKEKSEIIERDRIIRINKSALDIVKESCEYYGSSFEGKLTGSKKQLGMRYKLPIAVESSMELIVFPTASKENTACCWISLNNIDYYIKEKKQVRIRFTGNQSKTFNISLETLENQIFRATKLLLTMRSRRMKEKC